MFIFILLGSIVCINAEWFRLSSIVKGGIINKDIHIDREKNLMTVSVGGVSHLPLEYNHRSSINLHDYSKGMLAIKDIDLGDCVITETNETLAETITIISERKQFNNKQKLENTITLLKVPILYPDATNLAGQELIEFCGGYKLFRGLSLEKGARDFMDKDKVLEEAKLPDFEPLEYHCGRKSFTMVSYK